MSSFHAGGGGFGSAPGGLPQGVSQAQLDEIKAFNAGLTQAGVKSRPSRSRGSGINRGLSSGISPGRGGGYAGVSNSPRPGSGVGYGGSASYSVGPSTPSSIAKSTSREAVPSHLRGRVDVSKTRWANLDNTGAGTLGGHSIGPLNSTATPPKSRSRSPTRNSILTAQRPQLSPPQSIQQQQQQPVIQPLHNVPQGQNQVVRVPTPPGRTRIVTNMTPDDPNKPWIPAHLQQTSCHKTIKEISRMTGLPLSELTSDGLSIPAHRPSNKMTSPASAFSTMAASRQGDVDQQNWLNLIMNKKQGSEENATVITPNLAANSNMTNNTAQPMLAESRWAPATNTAPQNGFASAFSAPAAATVDSTWGAQQAVEPSQPVATNNGWANTPGAQIPSPAASGWGAPVQQPVPVNNSGGWDTMGSTRWTQTQPSDDSSGAPPARTASFGSAPVPATPSNTGGWGATPAQVPPTLAPPSGHVRKPSESMSDVEMTGAILDTPVGNLSLSGDPMNQVLTAMPTLAQSRWATPNASATAFGGRSQPQASISRTFETPRQPLSETAPGGFSYINTHNQATPPTSNGWPTPTAPVQSAAPTQSQPFIPFNLADFNQRVAAELQQVSMRASLPTQPAQPAGFGPAHLRDAPQNINRPTPGLATENAPPKKVQYLKDSRWAH